MDHQSRSLSETHPSSSLDHHFEYRHHPHQLPKEHNHHYNEFARPESPSMAHPQHTRHPHVDAPYYTPSQRPYSYHPHPWTHSQARASFDDVPPSHMNRYDYPRHQDHPDDYMYPSREHRERDDRRYSGPHLHPRDQEYLHGRDDRRGPDSDETYGPREGPSRLREHHYYRGHPDRPPLPRHFDEPQELDPNNSKRSTERPPFRPPSTTSQPSHGLQEPDTKEDVDEDRTKSSNLRFGTTMPTTIDLQSAIESCDALCKFALHYSAQTPPSGAQELRSDSALDPSERANLHMIRSMNTTMLIGLQNLSRSDKPAEDEPSSEPYHNAQRPPRPIMEEDERINFGPGPPANEMVHELAKAATSIFQLAIRIKAWVGMTPAERELDEEINIIRGKRCLLMDKSLAVPIMDQHGNLQKDWAVVPGANSNSKSFYERQRDLEQQRKMVQQPRTQPPHQTQPHQTQTQQSHQTQTHSHHTKHDHPSHGGTDTERSETEDYRRHDSGFSSSSNSNSMSVDRSGGLYALSESNLTNRSVSGITQGLQNSNINNNNNSRRSSGSINGAVVNGVKNSTPENMPPQKYRKRAKRTQPPGRCLSCDSSDTPEWRRGPDGARTLCNACGLHYAKLLKRQNEQKQPPVIANTRMEDAPRGEQLQIITFPLRRQQRSESSENTTGGGGSNLSCTPQQDSGASVVRRPSQQSSVSSNNSPMTSQREPFPRQELVQDGDVQME